MTEIIYKKEAYELIGVCMEVHRQLGNGFLESVYQEALELELKQRNIPFKREVKFEIAYKGQVLKKYYIADFICYNKIIVELKALSELATEHESQILNYLKATDLKLGLLVNFGTRRLQYKRLVNEYSFSR